MCIYIYICMYIKKHKWGVVIKCSVVGRWGAWSRLAALLPARRITVGPIR